MSDLDQYVQTRRQAPDVGNMRKGDRDQDGVTVGWLGHVFSMNHQTVRQKLVACPVKRYKQRGSQQIPLYDIAVASSYLAKVRLPTREYLRALKRNDLPPALQQQVWDALLKRQKWEENAGALWRTEKVREVLGGTFQTIKFQTQLWVDTIERQTGLTKEQRELLVVLSDELLREVHTALVEQVSAAQTGSQLDELAELVGDAEPASVQLLEADDEEDDDGMDLV